MSVDVVQVAEAASIGLVITAAASPVVLGLLRRSQILDTPNERSSHAVPTPRGGGLACLLGVLGALALAPGIGASHKLLLVTSGGALALLGFVDDVRHLKVRLRFGVQVVVAGVGSCWAFNLSWLSSTDTLLLAGLGVLWIVAYVNAFNFMDGINGLAGAASVVAGATFVVVGLDRNESTLAIGGAAVAGAALAFMPWNFPRARFFLGDVGSYMFGGTTAVLVAIGIRAHLPPEALIGPEIIFLADTGWTLARRIARGEDWTSPHRTHVYQQLQGSGLLYARTTAVVTLLMITTGGLGLMSLAGSIWVRLLTDAAGLILVGAYLASPRTLQRLEKSMR